MAITGKIINVNTGKINMREGYVLFNLTHSNAYFQIRTYAMGDLDRKNGSKRTSS